jgi:hypothetical protein
MRNLKKIFSLQRRGGKLQILILGLLGVFAIAVIVQMQQVWQMRDRLEVIDSLGDNNTKVIEEMGLAKSFLMGFGADLNEIREFLLLPTRDYNFGDLGGVEFEEGGEDTLTMQVFELISALADYETNQERYAENLEDIKEYFASEFWSANSLRVDGFRVYDDLHEGMELLNLVLNLDGTFEAEFYDGPLEIEGTGSATEVIAVLDAYFGGVDGLRALIDQVNANRVYLRDEVFVSEEFVAFLEEKGAVISQEQEEDKAYYWNLSNGDGVLVAQVKVSKEDGEIVILVDGELSEFVISALGDLDFRTALEVLVDESADELRELMQDEGFAAILSKSGYSVGEVVDDESRLSFEILGEDGEVLRVLYLDKATGEVRVEEPEVGSEDLASAILRLESYGKKKLWI